MSIKIIRAGILDTIQDKGRHGWRHLGINPGGAMDLYSAQLANIIAGNDKNDAVIEIHFPGSVYQFVEPAVIVITGADFNPTINEKAIALNQPVYVSETSILRFVMPNKGARCYLALSGGFSVKSWMDSFSTNIKAMAGGYDGRRLLKNDIINYRNAHLPPAEKNIQAFDFAAYAGPWYTLEFSSDEFFFIQGPEWDILTDESKSLLKNEPFHIQNSSDRMGYQLSGPELKRKQQIEMVSSPVAFGTIQLLPDGQLIILMADHQTTGGYPRIGCIVSSHLPVLAQKRPGDQIKLEETNIHVAEKFYALQQEYLSRLEKEIQERIIEK